MYAPISTGHLTPEIVRSVGVEIEGLRDITYIFCGDGHLQLSSEVDAVLRMMLVFRDDLAIPTRTLLRHGLDSPPFGANGDETEQEVRHLVAKLKQHSDVEFVFAWFIEGLHFMDMDHSENLDPSDAYNTLVERLHPEVRRQLGVG